MPSTEVVLLGLTIVFGFYMAWSIGANDVANAMGTSVGSGALTLRRAVIVAAILEFAGAYFAGSHVTDTLRSGLLHLPAFEALENGPMVLALGMIAALLAAGAWLQLASFFGWPVSTTHSIVGAVIGFGAVGGGVTAVNWSRAATIGGSWVLSPLLSGLVAFLLFRLLLRLILFKPDPVRAARAATPWLAGSVLFILSMIMLLKGLKNFDWVKQLPIWQGLLISLAIGAVTVFLAALLVRRIPTESNPMPATYDLYVARSLEKVQKQLRRIRSATAGPTHDAADRMLNDAKAMYGDVKGRISSQPRESQFREVERIFVYLQILTACFVAFAHGSNDVANAVGPWSAAWDILSSGQIALESVPVPGWVLALGGVGIVIGLATWGWRVMETIGRRITELTPTRGFCAEFAAATTIVLASVIGLPISTTHTLVGAVLGVGLARGIQALNLNTARDVAVSWLVTIPAGAGLAILFFLILRAIFIG